MKVKLIFILVFIYIYYVFIGREQTFAHYFHGFLAGLSILKDKTESDRVIKCLNNCKEYLDFHAVSEMHSGTVSSLINV